MVFSIFCNASCREWEKCSPNETWKSIQEPETLQGRSAGLQFTFCSHRRMQCSVPCSQSSSLQQLSRSRGKKTHLRNLFIEFICMLGTLYFPWLLNRCIELHTVQIVIVKMHYAGLLLLVAYVQCPYIRPTWPNLSALSPNASIRLLNVLLWACESRWTLIAYR